jgi:hypothetical protein
MTPRYPCIQCGAISGGTRCPTHQREYSRQRSAQRTQYHGGWEGRSKRARQQWVAEHGWVCPGWGVPAHPDTRLELDHTSGLVLCNVCNVHAGPAPGGRGDPRRGAPGTAAMPRTVRASVDLPRFRTLRKAMP